MATTIFGLLAIIEKKPGHQLSVNAVQVPMIKNDELKHAYSTRSDEFEDYLYGVCHEANPNATSPPSSALVKSLQRILAARARQTDSYEESEPDAVMDVLLCVLEREFEKKIKGTNRHPPAIALVISSLHHEMRNSAGLAGYEKEDLPEKTSLLGKLLRILVPALANRGYDVSFKRRNSARWLIFRRQDAPPGPESNKVYSTNYKNQLVPFETLAGLAAIQHRNPQKYMDDDRDLVKDLLAEQENQVPAPSPPVTPPVTPQTLPGPEVKATSDAVTAESTSSDDGPSPPEVNPQRTDAPERKTTGKKTRAISGTQATPNSDGDNGRTQVQSNEV
jgi:hypothetical protein